MLYIVWKVLVRPIAVHQIFNQICPNLKTLIERFIMRCMKRNTALCWSSISPNDWLVKLHWNWIISPALIRIKFNLEQRLPSACSAYAYIYAHQWIFTTLRDSILFFEAPPAVKLASNSPVFALKKAHYLPEMRHSAKLIIASCAVPAETIKVKWRRLIVIINAERMSFRRN